MDILLYTLDSLKQHITTYQAIGPIFSAFHLYQNLRDIYDKNKNIYKSSKFQLNLTSPNWVILEASKHALKSVIDGTMIEGKLRG